MLFEINQVVKDKHMISPISGTLMNKINNEQNRTRDMEIKNKLTVTSGMGGEGQQVKEGEGYGQGTCIKDPWTRTMGSGLTVGVGVWSWNGKAMVGGKLG